MSNEASTVLPPTQETVDADQTIAGLVSFFSRSANVALSDTTIVNILGSYYGYGERVLFDHQQASNRDHIVNQPTNEQGSPTARAEGPASGSQGSTQPIIEKSSAELYSKLGKKDYGTPLYIPQPGAELPKADRREGIRPGSIGRITRAGNFEWLYNIFKNSLSSSHRDPSIIQTNVNQGDIIKFKPFNSNTFVATPGISRIPLDGASQTRIIAKFKIDSDTDEGALLVLPQGADCEYLANMKTLQDYIGKSGPALYAYANTVRGRQIKNGELSVVYNCHKSKSWAIATFQNTSTQCGIAMTLTENATKSTHSAPSSEQSAGAQFAWDNQGTVHGKVGPEDENNDLAGGIDDPPVSSLRNQCLFVRTIKIRLHDKIWRKLFPSQDIAVDLQEDISEIACEPQPSVLHEPSRSDTLHSTNNYTTSNSHNDEAYLNSFYDSDEQQLSDIVTTFLLKKRPKARVAISSDSNWSHWAFLKQKPTDILANICAINEICEQDGLVFFEPKESFPSKQHRELTAEALRSGALSLQEFLFGFKQSREERCAMLRETMEYLRDAQVSAKPWPTLFSKQPLRVLSIENAISSSCSPKHHISHTVSPIIHLRKVLDSARTETTVELGQINHGQMLGQSLLHRFWNLGNQDDLHEAVSVFTDALMLSVANTNQVKLRLEISLDFSLALFVRYKLFQQAEDLGKLKSILKIQEKVLQLPACSWVWQVQPALPQVLTPPPAQDVGGQDPTPFPMHWIALSSGGSGPPDRPPHWKGIKHSAPQFPPPFRSPQYGGDPAPIAIQWGVSSPNPPSSHASGFPSPGGFGSLLSSPSQFPVPSTDHVPLSPIYHPPAIPEPHITQLPSSSGPYAHVLPTHVLSVPSFVQPTIGMPEAQPSTAPPYHQSHSVGSDTPSSHMALPPPPLIASLPSPPLMESTHTQDMDAPRVQFHRDVNFRPRPPSPRAGGSRLSGTTTTNAASSSSAPNVARSRRQSKHEPSRNEKFGPNL